MATNLQLDRSKANLLFSSWTLARDIVKSATAIPLPGGVATQETDDYDYVHTRFSALHNHLLAGGCYAFLCTAGGLSLQELQPSAEKPSFSPVAVLGETQQGLGSQAPEVEAALPPSVAEVAIATGQQGPPGQTLLLVSRGHGDLLLMLRQAGGVGLSAAVHPLRPQAPLQGVRPFVLEAAVQVPDSGHIHCVLWAVRPRSDTQPSRCEVFAVTLALAAPAGAAQAQGSSEVPELQVLDVKLLRRSPMSPHGVLANPATGALLLALDPTGDGAEEATPVAARGAAAQPHAEPVDDSGDPVSPRTLQAAAARLAQYTSEEPVGPLPQSQWADLYSESGPDGVGDVGQEPACTLYVYDAALSCVEQIPCLPHKVLSCQLQQDRLLLGLTDDVDCAVVEVACMAGAAGSQDGLSTCGFKVQHATSVPALAYVAAGKLQRKFLLLTPPGGSLGAALVESQRYAYLYRATAAGQEYGQQEVVELGLPEGSQGVLGAALVPAAGGASRLLLLTSSELRTYECS
ncbi:hypothetical protein N2152v2_007298 [Parachlorella kessleri]